MPGEGEPQAKAAEDERGLWITRASGAENGAELSPLSHASKKSFSFRVFSSFTSRTSFSAITSLGDEEEDGEESREEEEAPEGSVLGHRAATVAPHEGGRPGDRGRDPVLRPAAGPEKGWVGPTAASARGPLAPKSVPSPGSQHSPSTDSPRSVAAPVRPQGPRPLPSRLRPGRTGPRRSGEDRVAGARAAERGAVPEPQGLRGRRRAGRGRRSGAVRGKSREAALQASGSRTVGTACLAAPPGDSRDSSRHPPPGVSDAARASPLAVGGASLGGRGLSVCPRLPVGLAC